MLLSSALREMKLLMNKVLRYLSPMRASNERKCDDVSALQHGWENWPYLFAPSCTLTRVVFFLQAHVWFQIGLFLTCWVVTSSKTILLFSFLCSSLLLGSIVHEVPTMWGYKTFMLWSSHAQINSPGHD